MPYPCEHVCTLTGCYNIRSRPLRPRTTTRQAGTLETAPTITMAPTRSRTVGGARGELPRTGGPLSSPPGSALPLVSELVT